MASLDNALEKVSWEPCSRYEKRECIVCLVAIEFLESKCCLAMLEAQYTPVKGVVKKMETIENLHNINSLLIL